MFCRANWLCMGWPFCLAEMRREFQTGGKKFCTTLYWALASGWERKCCGQIEVEVVSNIRDKFHQTTSKPFAGARYTRSKSDMMSHDVLVTDSFGTDTDARAARWRRLDSCETCHQQKLFEMARWRPKNSFERTFSRMSSTIPPNFSLIRPAISESTGIG